MTRLSSPTRALVEYREAQPVQLSKRTPFFNIYGPGSEFAGRRHEMMMSLRASSTARVRDERRFYPLILSDSCGIAASVQGDAMLRRFTPSRLPIDRMHYSAEVFGFRPHDFTDESLARRADAHQRARILRDAAARISARSSRGDTGTAPRGHSAARLAAHYQEQIGNGERVRAYPLSGRHYITTFAR